MNVNFRSKLPDLALTLTDRYQYQAVGRQHRLERPLCSVSGR
jgi:hypothetical protein